MTESDRIVDRVYNPSRARVQDAINAQDAKQSNREKFLEQSRPRPCEIYLHTKGAGKFTQPTGMFALNDEMLGQGTWLSIKQGGDSVDVQVVYDVQRADPNHAAAHGEDLDGNRHPLGVGTKAVRIAPPTKPEEEKYTFRFLNGKWTVLDNNRYVATCRNEEGCENLIDRLYLADQMRDFLAYQERNKSVGAIEYRAV